MTDKNFTYWSDNIKTSTGGFHVCAHRSGTIILQHATGGANVNFHIPQDVVRVLAAELVNAANTVAREASPA